MIDRDGVHCGLFLYDMCDGMVCAVEDETHSTVHVNGMLLAGFPSAVVENAVGRVGAECTISPRALMERIYNMLRDEPRADDSICALDFSGELLAL